MTEAQKQQREAKKTVAQYKRLNAETVERVKTYDPKLRCWYFEKVQTDPNAYNFVVKKDRDAVRDPKKRKILPKSELIVRNNEIIRLMKEGASALALAEKYSLTKRSIDIIYENATRDKTALVGRNKTIVEMRDKGYKIREIMERVKLSSAQVRRIIKQYELSALDEI